VSLRRFRNQIFLAAIDDELTPKGYISPGVGDTGDRIFGTAV